MNIRFTLNTEQVHVDAMPHERLSTVLRRCFHLPSIKGSHGHGENGASTILFNGEAVSAYIIPFFLAHETQIVTLDFFKRLKEDGGLLRALRSIIFLFVGIAMQEKFSPQRAYYKGILCPTKKR